MEPALSTLLWDFALYTAILGVLLTLFVLFISFSQKGDASLNRRIIRCIEPPASWPQQGKIVFTNAESFYRSLDQSTIAMAQLSLTIEGSEHIQVIGRANSGKSSLLATLINLVEYTGSIKIDGVELSTVPRDRIISGMTSIPQEFVKLPGSIRDNAFPWDMVKPREEQRVDDITVMTVLRKVGLADFINQNGGIHSQLEEGSLSVTREAQFSIARGILHHRAFRTKIILVDDVGFGMPAFEQAQVQRVMSAEFAYCTVLFVAPERVAIPGISRILQFRNAQATVLA